jgi:hypothetical protein
MTVYEQELDRLRRADKSEEFNILKGYRVTGVDVKVGLKSEITEQRRKELKTWLEARVRREFGRAATVDVTTISKSLAGGPDEWQESLVEKIARIQWLLALIILGGLGFVSAIVFYFFRTRLSRWEKDAEINAKLKEEEVRLASEAAKREAEEKMREKESNSEKFVRFEREIGEYQKKICELVANLSRTQTAAIVSLLSKPNGGLKTACVVDAIVHQKVLVDNKVFATLQDILFNHAIPEHLHTTATDSFQKMGTLSLEEKVTALRETFWDLTSIGFFHDYADQRPLQFLRQLPKEKVSDLMNSLTLEDKVIALLHLPKEHQQEYLRHLPGKSQVDFIQATLEMPPIPSKELEAKDELLRQRADALIGQFVVSDKAVDLIASLQPSQEIAILRALKTGRPERAANLRSRMATFAFLDEWREYPLKTLVSALSPDEVEVLIRAVPEARDAVLNATSEMISRIVADELLMKESKASARKDELLKSAKEHMLNHFKEGLYSNADLYDESEAEVIEHAA